MDDSEPRDLHAEARERKTHNARKMVVTGRSAALLLNLSRQQANRRRTRRLKGAR